MADLNFRVDKSNLVCVVGAQPLAWPGDEHRDLGIPEHMGPVKG